MNEPYISVYVGKKDLQVIDLEKTHVWVCKSKSLENALKEKKQKTGWDLIVILHKNKVVFNPND